MTMIVGVLLAAGAGRRFGGHKLLAPGTDGAPIALSAALHLSAGVDWAIAVIRPGDEPLEALMREAGLAVIENPRADTGMASSLSAGIRAAPEADGWLIALADMPWIRPGSIAGIAAALRAGASTAAPVHNGRRGHPVGFARHWRADLLDLNGDQGARTLLEREDAATRLIQVQDPGVLADVDYPGEQRVL